MDKARQQYIEHLHCEIKKYRKILEEMFGRSDARFIFGTVCQSLNDPRTHYPNNYHTNGGCSVDIHIGNLAWAKLHYPQSTWQAAHECVHLLDPVPVGGANYLEEGLATWFQDKPQFHDAEVNRFITSICPHPERYDTAKRLVVQCMPTLIEAVKVIRMSGVRISDICPDVLAAQLPNTDSETITNLCARFPLS